MLTSCYKVIILPALLTCIHVSWAFAESQHEVETVSKSDTRLLQEKKTSVNSDNDFSWSSRYSSLLSDFQKMESELLAYKIFFAQWDIPSDKKNGKISRNLFREFKNIKKTLEVVLSKLDKVRLDILFNDDLKEDDKERLFQSILQLTENLKTIFYVPSKKRIDKGQVLDINLKLNSVIINLGIEQSISEGSYWLIRDEKREIIAELQVILVKKKLALAQVIKGNIKEITKDSIIERKVKK